MKKVNKYLLIYALAATMVAMTSTYAVVTLLETETIAINEPGPVCPSLEEQLRGMDADEVNSLLIIVGETLTAHYKEETREQVEKEHESYANRLALEHMNDVVGVLVKSIGAMPTSTLSNK